MSADLTTARLRGSSTERCTLPKSMQFDVTYGVLARNTPS
jgi:hypothetical protein